MKKHQCAKCGEGFDWFYKLVEHVTEKHPGENFVLRQPEMN